MRKLILLLTGLCLHTALFAQMQPGWHNQPRTLHYRPDGGDFVTVNGKRRFNRALYGTNTAFRAEAGDLPEFALYLPGIGGTLRLGLAANGTGKWLMDAGTITARYRPGAMLYTIEDPLLGKAILHLTVWAMSDAEGLLVEARATGTLPEGVSQVYAFGGATGKKLNRDGDIGADPESSFYLKPENCAANQIDLNGSGFTLHFGAAAQRRKLIGTFPAGTTLKTGDAGKQASPVELLRSEAAGAPVVVGSVVLAAGVPVVAGIQVPGTRQTLTAAELPALAVQAEQARKTLADRVIIRTPDPWINTLGGALSVAADAIWETPTYMHGAVAWRMRLNGWRGPYAGDPLGWHDRSRTHFRAYAKSQLTEPLTGPNVPDTVLHFARQQEKLGNTVFSSGYICRNPNGDFRPHHYDMNLVYIDELLWHINWTGDLTFVREIWPVLTRHLAWEKRNFDANNDGLYDAYCCIWASDALQYSGGGVTHSSAYNYRANRMAARLAALIGENPEPYRQEADTILRAVNSQLWLPRKGWYAEYKDLLGKQLLHPAAGLWTVYHAIDSDVPDPMRAYQTLRYVDHEIPHIPIRATGLADTSLYTLSTTNWMPYDWSLNNVVLAELMHTSLAYWQGGRTNEAFRLWKSALVESMYVGASPGNFQQLSFYDANRGELYRDFADPVGMAARSVVEGLFGIVPDALSHTLTIRPGLPDAWDTAQLTIPDVQFSFTRERRGGQTTERYAIKPTFGQPMALRLQVKAHREQLAQVTVNGKPVSWSVVPASVGSPVVAIQAEAAAQYEVDLVWSGAALEAAPPLPEQAIGAALSARFARARVVGVADPQQVAGRLTNDDRSLSGTVAGEKGHRTMFVQLRQGAFTWWEPLHITVTDPISFERTTTAESPELRFRIVNHTQTPVRGTLRVNATYSVPVSVAAGSASGEITVPASQVVLGSNTLALRWQGGQPATGQLMNWTATTSPKRTEPVLMAGLFNDRITNIFRNNYLSPRPDSPTLQLPEQGIGNWCYPNTDAVIDDAGLRQLAGAKEEIYLPGGIPFRTPGVGAQPNTLFVSQWDNYPHEASVPLTGRAAHAYLLMAGTSNPMQSQLDNGEVLVEYTDGTHDRLALRNPDTWWPVEQDYYVDGYAFRLAQPVPYRVHLKTGRIVRGETDYTSIKGFTNRAIDGGAATVLDLPLQLGKTLKQLRVRAIANDVIIGLLAVTLVRE